MLFNEESLKPFLFSFGTSPCCNSAKTTASVGSMGFISRFTSSQEPEGVAFCKKRKIGWGVQWYFRIGCRKTKARVRGWKQARAAFSNLKCRRSSCCVRSVCKMARGQKNYHGGIKKLQKVSALFTLAKGHGWVAKWFCRIKKKKFIKQNPEVCVEICAALRKWRGGGEESEDEKRLYEESQL